MIGSAKRTATTASSSPASPAGTARFSAGAAAARSRQHRRNALRPFATLFGLTLAETQLAGRLLDGKSVAEIAKEKGLTVATVRTHLYRLMAKTGSKRHSDLVRRIASFPKVSDE